MLDGGVLGTALIGQESVRRNQDPDVPPRPRRQTHGRRLSFTVVTIRGVTATALRALAEVLEPGPMAQRTTQAES